jgi:hypothetical protein
VFDSNEEMVIALKINKPQGCILQFTINYMMKFVCEGPERCKTTTGIVTKLKIFKETNYLAHLSMWMSLVCCPSMMGLI